MSSHFSSPNKSTIGLTSQQKDLLIIHLKGEVYELKQAESDYISLMNQVEQLEKRLKYLVDERDFASKDYQSKINGQEKNIQSSQQQLDELNRLVSNKEEENARIKNELQTKNSRVKYSEQEYQSLRDQNEDIIKKNKILKDEIAELMDRIEMEKDRGVDIKGAKDKANHTLYKYEDDIERYKIKEEELRRTLVFDLQLLFLQKFTFKEKQWEQEQKEARLKDLEQKEREKEPKIELQKSGIMDNKYLLTQAENDITVTKAEIERLKDQQEKLKGQIKTEEIRQKEHNIRMNEVDDKNQRRDSEFNRMRQDLREIEQDNDILKVKKDQLLQERDALMNLSEKLLSANRDIESELDSFCKLDESIVKHLEVRDEKLSPVVQSRHFNPINLNYQLAQSQQQPSYDYRQFDLNKVEQSNIQSYQTSLYQQNYNQQSQYQQSLRQSHHQSHSLRESQLNALASQQQLQQSQNYPLRFLNPRQIQQNEEREGLYQSQTATKERSPLRRPQF